MIGAVVEFAALVHHERSGWKQTIAGNLLSSPAYVKLDTPVPISALTQLPGCQLLLPLLLDCQCRVTSHQGRVPAGAAQAAGQAAARACAAAAEGCSLSCRYNRACQRDCTQQATPLSARHVHRKR